MPHPDLAQLVSRACDSFRAAFGDAPSHAAAAPGRVNLIGEHTDYNDGFVLPMAIDRWCVSAVRARPGSDLTRLYAADLGRCVEFDARRPLAGASGIVRGEWASYAGGVVDQLRAGGLLKSNLDLAFNSSVPLGSGLSSSASLEVSVARAALAAFGADLPARDLALLCQRAEHESAGVPCGIMDQLASVCGREGHALLIDCRSLEIRPVPLPPADRVVVLVINSGVRHELAAGEYARRRAACARAAAALGVGALRDASHADFSGLDDEARRCARHVVSENARTLGAAGALERGDLAAFGRLMDESHASLRDDYLVSCPELDTLVGAARACPGVLGARMTGGGFGGCIVALVEADAAERVAGDVSTAYRRAHGRECACFLTRAVEGAAARRAVARC